MFCKSCGYQLPKNDLKFCPQCGTPVNLPQQEDPEATKTLLAIPANRAQAAPDPIPYAGPAETQDNFGAPVLPQEAPEAFQGTVKKSHKGVLIGVLGAVAVLLLAAIVIFVLPTILTDKSKTMKMSTDIGCVVEGVVPLSLSYCEPAEGVNDFVYENRFIWQSNSVQLIYGEGDEETSYNFTFDDDGKLTGGTYTCKTPLGPGKPGFLGEYSFTYNGDLLTQVEFKNYRHDFSGSDKIIEEEPTEEEILPEDAYEEFFSEDAYEEGTTLADLDEDAAYEIETEAFRGTGSKTRFRSLSATSSAETDPYSIGVLKFNEQGQVISFEGSNLEDGIGRKEQYGYDANGLPNLRILSDVYKGNTISSTKYTYQFNFTDDGRVSDWSLTGEDSDNNEWEISYQYSYDDKLPSLLAGNGLRLKYNYSEETLSDITATLDSRPTLIEKQELCPATKAQYRAYQYLLSCVCDFRAFGEYRLDRGIFWP